MARPAQRYIDVDAYYTDMAPGRPTQIPREFPYTWNPVNGFEPDEGVGSIIDDLFNVGQTIVGSPIVQDEATKQLNKLLGTEAGAALLAVVQEKAAEGVTTVVKEKAPYLMVLAVAGGAIGGAVLGKMGKTGSVLAVALAGWAVLQVMSARAPGLSTPAPSTGPAIGRTPKKV